METITEKTTVKGKPEKVVAEKPAYTVTEKIVLRRASFRFLLAILILGIYAFTIYSLMYTSPTLDPSMNTLLVSTIGALTVLISQIGSFMYGDPKSDTSDGNGKEGETNGNSDKKSETTQPN